MTAEQLRRQRGAIKAKLTATENFLNRIKNDPESTTKEEIELRLHSLEEIHGKFQAIAQQISTVISEDESNERDVSEETEFDDRYLAARASLIKMLEELQPTAQATTSGGSQTSENVLARILEQQMILMRQLTEQTNNTSNDALTRILEHQGQMLERLSVQSTGTPREPHVKLPILKLPTFNGAIEEWKRYADTFKTLIHDSDLSNVQKHQYLVGSLSGAAAKVIESIEISDQNYTVAWELLKKRYEDDKVIRKRHIQCLFELPRVPRESAGAIQDLVDHVQKHLRVL
ncbi:hypothetical protein RF55_10858 [Lasius niger]|uniref:Uncharacterized protein n=1 Tax=Lasius niger TaxID=67767 RepID=A0A0J7KGV5_LASNI|nr:hypothetical protein RF55_10858 [Lasius niger]